MREGTGNTPLGEQERIFYMKTCFYCGRELAPGQRCSCRSGVNGTGNSDGAGASASASSAAENSSSHNTSYSTSSGSSYTESSAGTGSSAGKKAGKEKKTKQVWNQKVSPSDRPSRFTFAAFITKVRSIFPSVSKFFHPVMKYIWHPVTTIENRSQVVPIAKVLIVNALFATLTSLMVVFTSSTNSPFLGMLISLILGKTDLFSDHPVKAFFLMSFLLGIFVLILSLCFTWTSRLMNRKLTFLRALDTVSISSIYMCIADVLIFLSVLLGTHGTVTLLFVAIVIMGICHYVSIRRDLALSDNAAFNMLVISYLLFYVLAQLAATILIRIGMNLR